MRYGFLAARGGALGEIFRWFFKVLIYDIIVTSIAEIFGIPRIVALFIFLGIMIAIGVVGYIVKQRMSPGVDD
jgi:hypothetical protein